MKRKVYREQLAEQDLTSHVLYLSEQRLEAAMRFVNAVERAFDRLSEMPEIGASRTFDNPRLEGVRLWVVPEFEKYLIFYQFIQDNIRVLRVLHSSRDIQTIMEEADD
jgi:toxin ParE1/3/4